MLSSSKGICYGELDVQGPRRLLPIHEALSFLKAKEPLPQEPAQKSFLHYSDQSNYEINKDYT